MLPREYGGVVDKSLKVYGTQNVRVIDASVPPISFSAHLMSITYGLAEMGSQMILHDYASAMTPTPVSNTSTSSAGASTRASAAGAPTSASNPATSSASLTCTIPLLALLSPLLILASTLL